MGEGELARRSIVVWLVPREGPHRDRLREAAALDTASRKRINEIEEPEARDAQLLSRAWAVRALGTCFGSASGSWEIRADCSGRAVVRGAPPEVSIGFAHGRDTIAVAVGHDCGAGLGVDIEDRLGLDDPLLAPVILSQAELGRYHSLATGDRRRRYLLLRWVAKEAYAKAVGKGLALPFETMEMSDSAPEYFDVHDPWSPEDTQWRVRLFEPDDGSAVAVAFVPTGDEQMNVHIVRIADAAGHEWNDAGGGTGT